MLPWLLVLLLLLLSLLLLLLLMYSGSPVKASLPLSFGWSTVLILDPFFAFAFAFTFAFGCAALPPALAPVLALRTLSAGGSTQSIVDGAAPALGEALKLETRRATLITPGTKSARQANMAIIGP